MYYLYTQNPERELLYNGKSSRVGFVLTWDPKTVFRYWGIFLEKEFRVYPSLLTDNNGGIINKNDFTYLDYFYWTFSNFWDKFTAVSK